MEKKGSIFFGVVMILIGTLFLLGQLFPELASQLDIGRQWPLLIVFGGVLFLIGAIAGSPPQAVPGSIISGIGGILYYQNLSGNWSSWAFVWTLIPGFVGIGTVLMGLLGQQRRHNLREGGRLILVSLVMFAVFGAFFNGLGSLGQFWPVLLILAGLMLLFKRSK